VEVTPVISTEVVSLEAPAINHIVKATSTTINTNIIAVEVSTHMEAILSIQAYPEDLPTHGRDLEDTKAETSSMALSTRGRLLRREVKSRNQH
jgi:hypothetical protein